MQETLASTSLAAVVVESPFQRQVYSPLNEPRSNRAVTSYQHLFKCKWTSKLMVMAEEIFKRKMS
jgi:hypothetical protein